nr:hypothetical protein CFP56_52253 [Quercus suber]
MAAHHDAVSHSAAMIDEPATAAGPGATTTSAMPTNVTTTEGEVQNEKDLQSAADSVDQDGRIRDEEQGVTAEKQEQHDGPPARSAGKVALIMLALGLAVFVSAGRSRIRSSQNPLTTSACRTGRHNHHHCLTDHQRAFPLCFRIHMDWFRFPAG